jgi:TonB family protein
MKTPAFVLVLAGSLLPAVPAVAREEPAAGPPSFEQVDRWTTEGRFQPAAQELVRLSMQAESSLPAPKSQEARILRRAIRTARSSLGGPGARAVLCRARTYFSDELDPEDTILRVGEHVQRPELIERVEPRYPKIARRAGIQGTVILETVVDKEGCVRHLRVLRGLPMGLDGAAVAAVRNWVFEPAQYRGKPVAVYYLVTVAFRQDAHRNGPASQNAVPPPPGGGRQTTETRLGGSVVVDAGSASLYVLLQRFPEGSGVGRAVLLSAEQVARGRRGTP